MTHPIKFRRHVLRIKEQECLSFARVAERFSVGVASVKRWSKRIDPKQHDRKKTRKIDLKKLAQDDLVARIPALLLGCSFPNVLDIVDAV